MADEKASIGESVVKIDGKGLPGGFPLDLAALTLAISAVAALYGGIRAFYFEGAFVEAFSYFSDERTFNEIINSLIGRDPEVTLFGIHAFGDYVIGNVWASFADPWVEAVGVNYLPPVLLVFRILGLLPYALGIGIFFAAIIAATVAPMVIASRGYSLAVRVLLILILAVMTGPSLATFDRGNIQGLLPLVLFVFAVAVMKKRWGWAVTMIVIASLVKAYPIVLVLLLLALRQYKWAAIAVVLSGVITVLTLPIVASGGMGSLGALVESVLQFQDKSVVDFLQYNVSFSGGVANAAYLMGLPDVGAWIAGNALLLVAIYAAAVIPILWIRGIDTWIKVVVTLSLTTALMPIVYAYALNWVLAASAFVVWITRRSDANRIQSRAVSYGLILVLALGTAVLPIFIPGAMESGRPAGVVTLAALGMYVLLPLVAYASRKRQGVNRGVEISG